MYIDTHVHLNNPDLLAKVDEVINSALSQGVTKFIVPGYDFETSRIALELAHKYQEEYNSFVTICDDVELSETVEGPLAGIPCAIKDNISTKGILTTASSNILKN